MTTVAPLPPQTPPVFPSHPIYPPSRSPRASRPSLPFSPITKPSPTFSNGSSSQQRPEARIEPVASGSRSAPSSPAGRSQLSPGLIPLSTISPLTLDQTLLSLTPAQQQQIYQQLRSQPVAGPSRQVSQPAQPVKAFPASSLLNGPSRVRPRGPSSSSSDDEGIDSDYTVTPDRLKGKHKKSQSQPDLVRLKEWQEELARRQRAAAPVAGPSQSSSHQTVTMEQITQILTQMLQPLASSSKGKAPARQGSQSPGRRSPLNRSRSSLNTMTALRQSPKSSSTIPPLTPATPDTLLPPPLGELELPLPAGGLTGPEDADDDYSHDGSTSSADSVMFRTRPKGLRRRIVPPKGLGLDLGPENNAAALPETIERMFKGSSLLGLRLLAVIPSVWGIGVLFDAFLRGGVWADVWPKGVDLSREAVERWMIAGSQYRGAWLAVDPGDMVLSIAWVSVATLKALSLIFRPRARRTFAFASLPG